jgi:TRAP-type transport system periplasmic protein
LKENISGKKVFFICGISALLMALILSIIVACSQNSPTTTTSITSSISTTASNTQPAGTTKTIKLVLTSTEPPVSWLPTDIMIPWFNKIEQATGGAVKIEPHWGAELAESNQTYDAVVKGIADMGAPIMNETPNIFPLMTVTEMNSYDVNCYKRSLALAEMIKTHPEMQAEYKRTKLLWVMQSDLGFFATSKKPLRTLEDCQGMKMLGVGEWIAAREKALGMIPTQMAPMDMMPGLQKGVLDGSTVTPWILRDFQMGAFLKYLTDLSCSLNSWAFVVNLDTWNKIPANTQKIIEDVSLEQQNKIDEQYWKMVSDRIGSAPKEFGIEVINLSAQEKARWANAESKVREDFVKSLEAKGLQGQKMMADYQALEKKYAAAEYAPNK